MKAFQVILFLPVSKLLQNYEVGTIYIFPFAFFQALREFLLSDKVVLSQGVSLVLIPSPRWDVVPNFNKLFFRDFLVTSLDIPNLCLPFSKKTTPNN